MRNTARELVKCDGVTLVLREGDEVYYADEDAIGPLWKGQRFRLEACMSGLSIRNREQIAVEDIYQDPRVPREFYRKTFVKSMAVTPVGHRDPIAVIGAYWARKHRPTARELALLQALADCVYFTMNNIKLRHELESLKLASDSSGETLASLYRKAEHEIASLRQAEKALRLMDLVVEESPALIAIVGRNLRYERVNPAYARILKLPREKIVGRPVSELLGLDQFDSALQPHLKKALANDRVDFESWLPVRGNIRRFFSATCVPLRLERDEVESIALILRDLTERKLMEEALQQKQGELQAFSGRLLQAQEEERSRIARELHDSLSQTLTDSVIELQKLASDLPGSFDEIGARIESIANGLADLADFLHDMARELHPPVLLHAGLAAALEELCEEFSRNSRVATLFTGKEPAVALSRDVQLALYRVAQECLRNVAKHSRAKRAWVKLTGGRNEIKLSIGDNGVGFRPEERGIRGVGISGMEERMRLAGGRLAVKSRPGQGTEVTATIPVRRE